MSTPPPALSTSSSDLPELRLKPREERRIAGGHLWIFSNEVDTVRTPLTAFATGAHCRVVASNDRFLGYAYVNPHALICARILGRDPGFAPGKSLIVHRLQVALALREKLYAQPFYRLVYGESDGLPGLVLDRFGDIVVGQIGTAGMEAMKPAIVEAVVKVLGPKALIWKNDSGRPRTRRPAELRRDGDRARHRRNGRRGKRRSLRRADGPRPEDRLVL